jgi:pyruvate kinase
MSVTEADLAEVRAHMRQAVQAEREPTRAEVADLAALLDSIAARQRRDAEGEAQGHAG